MYNGLVGDARFRQPPSTDRIAIANCIGSYLKMGSKKTPNKSKQTESREVPSPPSSRKKSRSERGKANDEISGRIINPEILSDESRRKLKEGFEISQVQCRNCH